jgi:hypothetical protein
MSAPPALLLPPSAMLILSPLPLPSAAAVVATVATWFPLLPRLLPCEGALEPRCMHISLAHSNSVQSLTEVSLLTRIFPLQTRQMEDENQKNAILAAERKVLFLLCMYT